jgi:translation initiation factor IF-1
MAVETCWYCGRPASVYWDDDLSTCRHEMCEALAYGELKRRARNGHVRPAKKPGRLRLHRVR